jgi:hypothetical protein
MSGHVQRAKGDPEAQRKSSLSDCTWLQNENGSFNLEALNFLMHFREPGSSLYCLHILIFFLFLIFLLLFFLSFSHSFIFSCHTFGHKTSTSEFWFFYLLPFEPFFLNCSPLNSKNCIVPTSSPMLRRCSSSSKEVINKVGTGNSFPWRDTWILQCWHRLVIFLELMIHSQR